MYIFQPTSTQTPNFLQKPRPFRPLTSPLPPLTGPALQLAGGNHVHKVPDVKHEHIHYHIQAGTAAAAVSASSPGFEDCSTIKLCVMYFRNLDLV